MSLAPVAGTALCTIIKRRWYKIEIGFFIARRAPLIFNLHINSSIPSRERQFAFSNAKGAASAFGTSKAASVGGLFHFALTSAGP
jgi:hypothetical protein